MIDAHRRRIQRELEQNPAWRVRVGNAWLCPYCLDAVARELDPDLPADLAFQDMIEDHLAICRKWGAFQGQPATLADVKRRARQLKGRDQIRGALLARPAWQLYDVTRRWYCPFCAQATEVRVKEGGRISSSVLQRIEQHLGECAAYAHGHGEERSLDELRSVVGYANRTRKMAEQVRRKIESDAAWRLRDAASRWVCPFCRQVQPGIDFSTSQQMLETAPLEIARHLVGACERFGGRSGAESGLAARGRAAPPPPPPPVDDASSGSELSVPEADIPAARERSRGASPHAVGRAPAAELAKLGAASNTEVIALSGAPPAEVSGELPALVRSPARFAGERGAPARGALAPPLQPTPAWPSAAHDEPTELSSPALDLAAPRHAPRRALAPAVVDEPAERDRYPLAEVDFGAGGDPDGEAGVGPGAASLGGPGYDAGPSAAHEPGPEAGPGLVDIDGLELRLFQRRARHDAEDLVEVIQLDPSRVAIAVGTISTDGSDRGIFLPLVRNFLRMHGRRSRSPREVLLGLDKDLTLGEDAQLALSVTYVVIDAKGRSLSYARAGGSAPVVFHRTRGGPQALVSKGVVVGLGRGAVLESVLEERREQLRAGDLIVLYTQGVLAAEDNDRRAIGQDAFFGLVERYGRHEADYFAVKLGRYFEDFTRGAVLQADASVLAVKLRD